MKKAEPVFEDDAVVERDACLTITKKLSVADDYYSLTTGVEAHQKMCTVAVAEFPNCALYCNMQLNKMKENWPKEACDAMKMTDPKFKQECNDRVNGSLVWSNAAAFKFAAGSAAVLSVSMALF